MMRCYCYHGFPSASNVMRFPRNDRRSLNATCFNQIRFIESSTFSFDCVFFVCVFLEIFFDYFHFTGCSAEIEISRCAFDNGTQVSDATIDALTLSALQRAI